MVASRPIARSLPRQSSVPISTSGTFARSSLFSLAPELPAYSSRTHAISANSAAHTETSLETVHPWRRDTRFELCRPFMTLQTVCESSGLKCIHHPLPVGHVLFRAQFTLTVHEQLFAFASASFPFAFATYLLLINSFFLSIPGSDSNGDWRQINHHY
jgi:hypothetical protein